MLNSRRDFIRKALSGLLALLGLGLLLPGVKILLPPGRQEKKTAFFPLISEEDVPRAGVKKAELVYSASGKERKARVFIVSSSQGLLALSATCSHLGCLVNYHKDKREFICPCHGGRYDLTGKNTAGPPPAPLTTFPVKIQDGMVYIGIKV